MTSPRRRRIPWIALGGAVVLLFAIAYAFAPVGPRLVSVGPLQPATKPLMEDGMNIPWSVGGQRIERDGKLNDFPGTWPTTPVSSQRLWDTRTAWADLEPANDQFTFSRLDQFVDKAKANGVNDIVMVLGGTPQWAASKVLSTDAPWIGPGSASMPANLDDWRQFVTTVASRYAGRITAYEIGNEPNLLTFWNGTPEQWRVLVSTATDAIHAADPGATVAASVGVVSKSSDVKKLATWLKPIAPLAKSGQIDAVAVHFYPRPDDVTKAPKTLKAIVDQFGSTGWGKVPRWITELNVRNGVKLATSTQVDDVSRLARDAQKAGFDRLYWYAWTSLGPEDLIQFYSGQPGEAALQKLATS